MDLSSSFSNANMLEDQEKVSLEDYLTIYGNRISQDSERLFLSDFLYPILGTKGIKFVIPQYPFLDTEGRSRRIDFALIKGNTRIALEVNGETYHAEGIIPNEMFDDNLQRQNEILTAGWHLLRFSYNQLLDRSWRPRILYSLRKLFVNNIPEIVTGEAIQPNRIQAMALDSLDFYRKNGWKKGIVVMPTGTGKTFLSVFDSKRSAGRILYIVHRLDILNQSKDAFNTAWPNLRIGTLTGEIKENVFDSTVLFASKDALRNPETLRTFSKTEFAYIIVDEVHHGQAPTYSSILSYFEPSFFMLGMTATPDRMDRKDIFELFQYNKVFEYTLNEAIENGYLVPYTYYGLIDNIDYSNIRYNGVRYNVQDLEKNLIIEKRNKEILKEFLEKGGGNKALCFCCSIEHAERMAEFFNKNGIPSISITSATVDRDEEIKNFRRNQYNVAFTVDLFNEGIDFPELRVLLFLRPTESKTVFEQQLGRGLRLHPGKEKVIILDFIGNYRKANQIRKFLSKKAKPIFSNSGRITKIEYQYVPGCEVRFDAQVEEIFNIQDEAEREVTKEDLAEAYFELAEAIRRKPTQDDINSSCKYKMSKYFALFGSWVNFLRNIGEYTESSYHYPQGVHIGHALYILKVVSSRRRGETRLDDRYIKLRGSFSEGRLGHFQRQTKYKLQALMEMGILIDDRTSEEYSNEIRLTLEGERISQDLAPLFDSIDLEFQGSDDSVPSWDMKKEAKYFNEQISEFIKTKDKSRKALTRVFLRMPAVAQMLNFIYRVKRKETIPKLEIYDEFFKTPFVKMYCDQNGIEVPTQEGAKHRCPFLLNILESIGVISQTVREVKILKFVINEATMKIQHKESKASILYRSRKVEEFFNKGSMEISEEEESILKETFGINFLTEKYFLKEYEIILDEES